MNVLVFGEDRRLIEPTMLGLMRITNACVTATRSKGGMANLGKLLLYHFQRINAVKQAVTTSIPAYRTTTCLVEPPLDPSFASSLRWVCLPSYNGVKHHFVPA